MSPRRVGGLFGEGGASAVALGASLSVSYTLPVFISAAVAAQIMSDLGFGPGGLGLAVGCFWGSGAVLSPLLGRLSDRLGARVSIRISALIAAVTAGMIGATAASLPALTSWLVFGGTALALGQPAANRLLSRAVRTDRLGLAFGVSKAAPPIATLIAGMSVPLIATNVGWRWTYLPSVVLATLVMAGTISNAGVGGRESRSVAGTGSLRGSESLLRITVSFGVGTATASAVATFYVESSVRAGVSPAFAGSVLAVGSAFAILTRVIAGLISDVIVKQHLRLCGGLLAWGAFGTLLLGGGDPVLTAVGLVIAMMGTWGFAGVLWYALIRMFPDAPGAITGRVAPGVLIGQTIGPLLFGVMAEAFGHRLSWVTFGAIAALASFSLVRMGSAKSIAGPVSCPDRP